MKIGILFIALAGGLSLAAVDAQGGTPTDQLKASVNAVVRILNNPPQQDLKAKERFAAIRAVAQGIFDFAESAERSLGRHWQGRTREEQEEFTKLFRDLLERAYLSKLDLLVGEKIIYLGESVDGNQATVRTSVTTENGSLWRIEYRMLLKGERWLVYDVSFDGFSVIANYRSQFNKIIQTSSYQELVKKLRSKQEETSLLKSPDRLFEKKEASVAAAILMKIRGSYKN